MRPLPCLAVRQGLAGHTRGHTIVIIIPLPFLKVYCWALPPTPPVSRASGSLARLNIKNKNFKE